MKHNDFITIGVIIAPHGVRGDLRIMPQTDFPERFMHMDACYIDGKEYHVASARFHKQFVLVSFKEIPDRNTAELFSKKAIQVRREDLVELPEGYDPTDRAVALKTLGETDGLVTGVIYQDTTKPSFEKALAAANGGPHPRPLTEDVVKPDQALFDSLCNQFK